MPEELDVQKKLHDFRLLLTEEIISATDRCKENTEEREMDRGAAKQALDILFAFDEYFSDFI